MHTEIPLKLPYAGLCDLNQPEGTTWHATRSTAIFSNPSARPAAPAALRGFGVNQTSSRASDVRFDILKRPRNGAQCRVSNLKARLLAPLPNAGRIANIKVRYQLLQMAATGTTGDDKLYGASNGVIFDGKGGNDYIQSQGGGDTFIFNAGYGKLEISEYDTGTAPHNVLQLGTGISASSVKVTSGSNSSIVLKDAIVKIEAFPYTRYGYLTGKVASVSNDATQNRDRKLGMTFTAHIRLPTNQMQINDKPVRLTPGMEVTAEIRTGRRSVAGYFLDPLMQTAGKSLHER
ncbi:hypothetical protein PQR33_03780 [Paraburkholderia sediminicola]|uniref:hypothetical protein n=1 Tax=Paraburkholderia sediminicola TaxID=458836 RepID=UPI0038BDCD04